MSAHTPGPWIQGDSDDHWKRDIRTKDLRSIAFCGSYPVEEAHANARLIAAAPELLEALVALTALYDTDEGCRSILEYQNANAAIAKATGEGEEVRAKARYDQARAAMAELIEAQKGVLASLVAAVSLLERGGKKAAPSDRMFEQMLADYRKSIDYGRAALARVGGAS